MDLRNLAIALKLPFFEVSTEWEPNDVERRAAWELLLELVTRVAAQPLDDKGGSLREALTSLYSLFGTTRAVLRAAGPEVAQDKGTGNPSLGTIALVVLNHALRPLLTEWHPRLLDYESQRPSEIGPVQWERQWADAPLLRAELARTREVIRQYALVLGEAAGATEFAVENAPQPAPNL
jgi:hypothetical protein